MFPPQQLILKGRYRGVINMKQIQPHNTGFSTLEMLIAMTLIILTLSAVTLTSFGNQSVIVDGQLDAEALNSAQELLEGVQTLARKDFNLVNPTSTTETIGAMIYSKNISVVQSDFFTKQITANVSWIGEHNRAQKVALSTLVTNFDNAQGGDTCSSVLIGDWTAPHIVNAVTELSLLTGTTTGANVITSIDAYKGRVYVTVNAAQFKTDPRLFIFDSATLKTDPTHSLLGKVTTATNTAIYGMYAVHVSDGPQNHLYAYVANDYQANWSACPAYYDCAQLSVVDVTNPGSVKLASTTYYKLTNIGGALNSGGAGNSIFYKNGLVYLGLTKSLSGPEFNIIDVHDPQHPIQVGSGINLDVDVNAITVVGNIAYLATSNDSGEVVSIDVSNPNTPILLSTYNAPGQLSAGYGRSLKMIGDRLYLGRSYVSNASELIVLDASSTSGAIANPPLGSRDLGVSLSPFTVYGVLVRDTLAFIAGGNSTNGKLFIERLSNISNITEWATPLPLPNNSFGFAIDCEGNDVFIGSRDNSASNLGYLSVITSAL